MSELKPAYLVCGDDDAKIDSWRGRVRRRAEEERGPGGLETFDAGSSEPDEVEAALLALTFDPGTRYVLVGHGVEAHVGLPPGEVDEWTRLRRRLEGLRAGSARGGPG